MQICPAYQLSGLSVLICIKLIKLYKNEIIQKIRAKQESGLTTVRLKRDPPVFGGRTGFDNELQINKQKQKFSSSSDIFVCNNVN